MNKYSRRSFVLIFCIILFGCSTSTKLLAPAPPKNSTHPQHMNTTLPNKNVPNNPTSFKKQESSVPFINVQETKANGGGFSTIKINNRGNLPSYYLYPNQHPDLNINNQQKNISTPTWQLNW